MKGKCRKLLLLASLLCLFCCAGIMQASARTTDMVASATKTSGGKWVTTSGGLKYRLKNGEYAKDSWRKIVDQVYYFDADGICAEGWFTYENGVYYATSIHRICAKEWHKIGKKYYYFFKSGRLAANRFVKTGGKYYYVNAKGARMTDSWVQMNGKTYYVSKNGVRLQKKWLKKSGKYYYFKANGVMAVNRWVGNYYVGSDGARLTDCEVDGYYLDSVGKKTVAKNGDSYIFVGDSRMVGMSASVDSSNVTYIAKSGMGYSWLKSTAGPELKSYLKSDPYVKVVLALGVNDLGNIQSYITYYKSLIKKYPDTQFTVLSVNPVNEKKEASRGYSIKNSRIKAFNKKLKASFGSAYLNSNKYMTQQGFDTVDGLHYTKETYFALYVYIMDQT